MLGGVKRLADLLLFEVVLVGGKVAIAQCCQQLLQARGRQHGMVGIRQCRPIQAEVQQ